MITSLTGQAKKNLFKAKFYTRSVINLLQSRRLLTKKARTILEKFYAQRCSASQAILARRDYYIKLNTPFTLSENSTSLQNGNKLLGSMSYKIDFLWMQAHFPPEICFNCTFGDVTHVPATPQIVKSRPIFSDLTNKNSVLLKLNQVRHYYLVKDKNNFIDKVPKIVWRGNSNNQIRQRFIENYVDNPLCNVGAVAKSQPVGGVIKSFMPIFEQLKYKYILSIEGNDVASNLKWILASNSLCFMKKPKYETWFMEGLLVPDKHFVLLKDDYSDLEEKILFFNKNPAAALEIISNAQAYLKQFLDPEQEFLLMLLVLDKYARLSNQQ